MKNNKIEPINRMYYTRRAILLYERVFGNTPKLTLEQMEELRNIKTQERFEEVCYMIQDELRAKVENATLSDEDKEFLEELNYASFLELADNGDFELITEKYHRRKFFNEIANDSIIDALITSFESLWSLPVEGPYFVEVYDLGDEAIFFNSYKKMKEFLAEYEVTPYTAFEVKGNCAVELYSE